MPREKKQSMTGASLLGNTTLLLAGIMIVSLAIRLIPAIYTISGGSVILTDPDSYYHMRRIAYTVLNYPFPNTLDSYVNYPYSFYITWPPLYDVLMATVALIAGLGHPGPFTIELSATLATTLLGVASVPLTYLMARQSVEKKAALVAALLMGIMPAAVFRSLFGITDHHVLEVLFSLAMYLLFIRAVSGAKKARPALSAASFVYAALAGTAAACLILSWEGAPIFIAVIAAYAFVQYVHDLIHGESSGYLTVAGIATSATALVVLLPFAAAGDLAKFSSFNAAFLSWFHVAYLLCMALFFLATGLLSHALARLKAPWYSLPAASAALAASAVAALKIALPGFLVSIGIGVAYLLGADAVISTISEAEPLFVIGGKISPMVPWAYFSFAGVFALIGLAAYLLLLRKRRASQAEVFLVVWTFAVLALGLMQKRFIYELAVNVSIFAGYATYKVLELAGLEQYLGMPGKKKLSASRSGSMTPALMAAAVVAAFFLLPVLLSSLSLALSPVPYVMDWNDACTWVSGHTPPASAAYSADGKPAYGVMGWWDYGNQIIYSAGRPAVANNFQAGVGDSARFFTAGDEVAADAIMDKRNARYVMLDERMGSPFAGVKYGIFEDIALLAGEDPASYRSGARANDKYYGSMYSRLFNGDSLDRYRLLYVTNGTDPVKVFEYVKGATIAGKAQPGATVGLSLDISSPYGEGAYCRNTTAGPDGTYAFIVPYATGDRSFIRTGDRYSLAIGASPAQVEVPEAAVEQGLTVPV